MISHKHKFIFIHIPKCGGTSVEVSLLKNEGAINTCDKDDLLFLTKAQREEYQLGYDHRAVTIQHKRIDQYKRWTDDSGKPYYTFTFVRNPWQRLVSEYFYIKRMKGCLCEDFEIKYPTFKDFVKNDGLSCSYLTHDMSQIDFVLSSNHGRLTNFVGRCEDMQYDFDYICGKIGIPKIDLPKRNPTKHEHYTEYYDDETKHLVERLYIRDIEYFGYEFGV
jgi:hypothetical protein